jgi:microcystin-dependent protein
MADPFLGEIKMVSFAFAPRGWGFCNGQLLPIAQNTALFALLGTTYGGNGQTTFAMPNLQDRAAIHAGTGPGLSPRSLGEAGGTPSHTLLPAEIGHTHGIRASVNQASTASPADKVLAAKRRGGKDIFHPAANVALSPSSMSPGPGGNQPHENRQPYLGITFVIALVGVFPSRN